MAKTADELRRYNSEYRRRYREQHGTGLIGRDFVGVDGEGGQDSNGHHQYYLLTAGSERLATGKPLTAHECLRFLCQLDPDPIYVAYFFDYDVTMMLRGLPPERVTRLLDRESRSNRARTFTFPVGIPSEKECEDGSYLGRMKEQGWESFQIDYMPRKEFKVRQRIPSPDGLPRWSKWVVVNDVGSFFQCAFLKTLEDWQIGTPEERQRIGEGKALRADFGQLTHDVIVYNALEIRLLAQTMEDFRSVCKDIDYIPARWQGPGNLASAMYRRHKVPKTRDYTVDPAVYQDAQKAYYGGRFETTAVGDVKRTVYQYDINSAYPYSLTQLPCLLHGTWHREGDPARDLYLAHGHFKPTEHAALYGFPCRNSNGGIFYPAEGNGWYWSPEIKAAVHQSFTPDRAWFYRTECDCQPFDWVPDVYAQRIALGKTARGKVLKLSLNSLYGKAAQSVGNPPYANPIFAGLITALTRAKLAEACHVGLSAPVTCACADVYMVATDAVFSGNPLPLEVNKELGGWDLEEHEGMFIVQPGLYFTSANTMPKTRGLPRQVVVDMEGEFRHAWDLVVSTGDVIASRIWVPLRHFIGLRVAHHRKLPDLAGEWHTGEGKSCQLCGGKTCESGKWISFEWMGKREPNAGRWEGPCLRTVPQAGSPDLESVPYSKDIGRVMDLARLDGWDQPDWADLPFGDEL